MENKNKMEDKKRVEGSSHEVTLMKRWHKQLQNYLPLIWRN
jgi:hypothetical protein